MITLVQSVVQYFKIINKELDMIEFFKDFGLYFACMSAGFLIGVTYAYREMSVQTNNKQ